jgi:hypothetical protein
VGLFRGLEAVSTKHDPLLFLAAFFHIQNTTLFTLKIQEEEEEEEEGLNFLDAHDTHIISIPYFRSSEAQKLAFGL